MTEFRKGDRVFIRKWQKEGMVIDAAVESNPGDSYVRVQPDVHTFRPEDVELVSTRETQQARSARLTQMVERHENALRAVHEKTAKGVTLTKAEWQEFLEAQKALEKEMGWGPRIGDR
ncbi:MAG: hypothetical protein ABSC71_05845 [Candidatus Acidiferrales bacterium]|jgi:hypothetical protein